MIAVIAEKPSVGREIAALLGATKKEDGFLSGGGYYVTWAIGHLVGLGMPEDYGVSGFQKTALPILPDPFLLTTRKIKKGKTYAPDPGAVKQLKVIEGVIKRSDSVIVATDAGREGELIFRYIYEYLRCDKPFQRLWISSLTEKTIRQGFAHLRPGSDFDGLYMAGRARSRADWLVGINASQALSIAAGSGVYSLGRVQTPTLALICSRYLEHKNFLVQPYWQISLEHRREFMDFKSLSVNKWEDKGQADGALKSIQQAGVATIASVESRTITEQPPLLFDLTGLQKEANKKLSFSAEETLTIAQSLYEQKFITYPRTGSRYITEDMWPQVPHLVRALDDRPTCKGAAAKVKWGQFNRRIVNELKVTDHHGLLITGKIPSALPAKENAIYDMIALRLLEAITQPCTKEITDIRLEVLHHKFALSGCKILEAGWRSIKGSFSDEDTESIQELPELKPGDQLKIGQARLLDKKTKAPALYSEATLLSAMETVGKQIEDQEQQKALQGIGIGTPATRAAIIEALLSRSYIQRVKKTIIPTEKGLQVYGLVKDKNIADVAMTAEWELALQKIEHSQADAAIFQKEIEAYATAATRELLTVSINTEKLPELTCPKCKSHPLTITEKIVKCTDERCSWLQFRSVCGATMSIADIESLVTKGRTSLIKGMKSKSGKKFNAYIIRTKDGQTSFEFENDNTKKK